MTVDKRLADEQAAEEGAPQSRPATAVAPGGGPISLLPVSRRQFLRAGLGAATAAALAACSSPPGPTPPSIGLATFPPPTDVPDDVPTVVLTSAPPTNTPTAAPPATHTPTATPPPPPTNIVEPPVLTAQNGVLDLTLSMEMRKQTPPGATDQVELRTLVVPGLSDGDERNFPAPTLRMKVGDLVRILLLNNLPPEADPEGCVPGLQPPGDPGVAPNCFHGLNTTNLHYHGSHVFPSAPGDDVLIKVKPGEKFQYEFPIHSNQAPGTHWYHPHKHGSTALQVLNGMAGAFIVEGDYDFRNKETDVPIKEVTYVIQQVGADLKKGGAVPIAINGLLQPTAHMRPGEVQRWRVIGATMQVSAIATLGFQPGPAAAGFAATNTVPEAYQIAQDGVQFAPEQWQPDQPTFQVDIAPGNRADFLVRAPMQEGLYNLVPLSIQQRGAQGALPEGVTSDAAASSAPVMSVLVAADDSSGYMDTLPPAAEWPPLPAFLCPITDQELLDEQGQRRRRSTVYSMNKGQGPVPAAPQFYIDCKQFTPGTLDHCMILHTAEEWTIYNTSAVPHPFHIHLNPFFVTDIHDPTEKTYKQGRDFQPMRWQDTIMLPEASFDNNGNMVEPGYVIVRQRFLDFTGTFVIHCHILGHEDRGMMQTVAVMEAENLCPPGSLWQDHTTVPACPDKGVPAPLTALIGTTPPVWTCAAS